VSQEVRPLFVGLRVQHERQQVLVPLAEEVEDADRDQAGLGQRQHDPEERAEVAGAVDERGLGEFLGQRLEESRQEEHRERQRDAA